MSNRIVGLLLLSILLYGSLGHSWDTYNIDDGYLTIQSIRSEIKAYLLNKSYTPRHLTTHPWITIKALKYLEESDSSWNALTPDEKTMIVSGSVEEDFDIVGSSDSNHSMYTHLGEGDDLFTMRIYPFPGSAGVVETGFDRAYNHFYTGGYDNNIFNSIVGRLDMIGPLDRTNAIYWALNSTINYKNLRYIRDNLSISKMQKLQILGNIIHLLEDMASPPHPNGDPHVIQYSEETALNKISFTDHENFGGSVSIPDSLPSYLILPAGAKYWEYFEKLSKFTREYFFSENRMFMDWHVGSLRDGQGARNERIINYKYPYYENGFRGYYIYTSMGRKLARYNHLLGYTALLNGDHVLASTWDEAKDVTQYQLYIDEYVAKDSWRELWPITVKYVARFTKDFYTREIGPSSDYNELKSFIEILSAAVNAGNRQAILNLMPDQFQWAMDPEKVSKETAMMLMDQYNVWGYFRSALRNELWYFEDFSYPAGAYSVWVNVNNMNTPTGFIFKKFEVGWKWVELRAD